MKYSYIARQPILDRDRKTIGYELLFRDGPKNTFPDIDPDLATSRLLSDHFLSTHYNTLGKHLGFVNFPYQSLINLVPTLFPAQNLVVEVLEDCKPTLELLEAIKKMAKLGYRIALDDFVPSSGWLVFFPYVSIIKFDIRVVSLEKAARFIQKLGATKIEFLAEKVETYEEFKQAKKAGFTYFQGYFFSKPEMLQRKALEPAFLTVVQLFKEIAKSNLDYKAIEELVATDLTLSYKLLTFVNSSATVSSKIHSFKQALIYLGEQRLRKFISLVAIASTQESKPDYLYGLSIQRARYCELIGVKAKMNVEPGSAFLTGMFSLLDSLLDQPLESIMEEMPIDEYVKLALIEGKGELGLVLELTRAYEQADWQKVEKIAHALSIEEPVVKECYNEAVKWTADLLGVHS
ncbi:EAL domain-containing protein [Vibrio anguillarum]|uniref:EAL and HDOD domain-containing protein n=1 Tax=Vibrio TaxID=662 RepID=UPI001482F641|nr:MULTISPECIES: EAL and HDOD domain-containing protein [Vibrio]MCC4237530.1 EAL domain-containing protein [Vibrio anguillarum]MDT3846116.1 EAL and HDOD domain-containing protein [Vibrio anguillarum]NNN67677.1 EAL domain-containing protein [Vibrio sp. 3-2(1)]NOI03910.1 EAL domain-containing protein [Vibrio anguillarum]